MMKILIINAYIIKKSKTYCNEICLNEIDNWISFELKACFNERQFIKL